MWNATHRTNLLRTVAVAIQLVLVACATPTPDYPDEVWPKKLRLDALGPQVLLPQSRILGTGAGFVTRTLGTSRILFRGTYDSDQGSSWDLEVAFPVEIDSENRFHSDLTPGDFERLCPDGDGLFAGQAIFQVASRASQRIFEAPPIPITLTCRRRLEPNFQGVEPLAAGLYEPITARAANLLLGTGEGRSWLVVRGCFLRQGAPEPCEEHGNLFDSQQLPLTVLESEVRQDATFVLVPDLVGLSPGTLEVEAWIENEHADGTTTSSPHIQSTFQLLDSRLESVDYEGSSLGGYVLFRGRGLIGAAEDERTTIRFVGTFTSGQDGSTRNLDLILFPEFVSGDLLRLVLDEEGPIGRAIDMRKEFGTLQGTFTPTFSKGNQEILGEPMHGSFVVQRIRQVVYVNFTLEYRDALELFGLLAADERIRAQILDRARWIYRGLNVEFRDEVPEDYLWYAQVDITGTDPNGLGLMGYDNTPGKDVGNMRLYDRIGGVNALTQEDGYPGYGGVFVESFFAFSLHPPVPVREHPDADGLFDAIFDPVRPDTGDPVLPDEIEGLPQVSGSDCPADPDDRPRVVACAIYVLGNLLGGTMAHELGHSLGLADPGGERFHNAGEAPNRLMDAGGARPFRERAVIQGGGPEVFCRQNFDYLQSILPADPPEDPIPNRPSCY